MRTDSPEAYEISWQCPALHTRMMLGTDIATESRKLQFSITARAYMKLFHFRWLQTSECLLITARFTLQDMRTL